jgi:NAD(P)H dehydrogenase (quinone)
MRTLIIFGHPDKKSFCSSLADSYEKGAKEKGGEVERLNLCDLRFDPILRYGYKKSQTMESDLIEAQRLIKWANHLVFVFPVWWSAPPALLKGFIDRVFIPGFAFQYRENSSGWDKLLTGKRARIIMTSNASTAWLYMMYFHPALHMMKKAVLEFCGVGPVDVTSFGKMKNASDKKREGILYKAYRAGLDDN